MADEQFDPGGATPYEPPSAARALEAARMAPQSSSKPPPHTHAHFETTAGSRYVLRTMQRDIAAALEKDKPSLGTVVLAEERRRRERSARGAGSEPSLIEPAEAPRRSHTATLAIVGGVLLFLGAIAVAVVVLLREPESTTRPPQTPIASALIPIDGSISPVTLSGLTTLSIRTRLREAVQKATTPINTVYAIPLVDRGQLIPEEKGAILVELTTDEFFRRVAPDVPAALRRALDPAFTFGVHAFDGNTAFLVFGVQSLEIAFAEMLSWERTLSLDLGPVFKRSGQQPPLSLEPLLPSIVTEENDTRATTSLRTAATSSAASTSSMEEFVPKRTLRSGSGRFEDTVIKNYDVRVLRDESGEPFLLYTFPNRSTLIIAGSVATLEEIIERLTTLKRE